MKDSSHQYRRWHQLKQVWMMRRSGVSKVVVAECSVTWQCGVHLKIPSRRRERAWRFCPLRMNRGSVWFVCSRARQRLCFRPVLGNLPSTWVLKSVCCYGYWFFVSVVNFGMMGRRVCLTRGWCQMRVLFKINLIFFFLSASFCCAGLLTRYFCHGGASILDCSFQSDFDHAQRRCRCKKEEGSFCFYN